MFSSIFCKTQGDQIGRIFAYWAIIFILPLLKIAEAAKVLDYF
jgi:hypothetical protein